MKLTKHHRHETFSVNMPPIKGPIEFAVATTIPRIPWYFPRFSSETTSETVIITLVRIPPPPIPEIAPTNKSHERSLNKSGTGADQLGETHGKQ
jgi:hypothetical protein